MTKKQQAHALQIAMHLRSRAQIASTPGNLDTLSASAANELERQHARIAELEDDLQFVERWAVHHGSKPSISAEEALSCIQHYPAIHEITKSYKDGKRPDTFNPYARIAELEGQLEAIGAGGVEPLRKPAAAQQAVPASVIAGAVFDFAGYLTTLPHKEAIHCSEAHEAAPMVEAITEWCKRRNLTTDGAKVETWRDHLAEAPAHPKEGVPEQAAKLPPLPEPTAFLVCKGSEVTARAWNVDQMRAYAAAALAATQPAAQGVEKDAARYLFLRDGDWRENDAVAPFIHLQLNALWDEKIDAAIAAQAKQGEQP